MPIQIYKIACKDESIPDCYVGQTNNFERRKSAHKSFCNRGLGVPVYNFIRENGGWENWVMEEVELVLTNDRKEAAEREAYWVSQLKATLNKNVPARDQKTYYEQNKEMCISQVISWREQNKNKYLDYQREYREKHMEERKSYYEKNKERILEQQKAYRDTRKISQPIIKVE